MKAELVTKGDPFAAREGVTLFFLLAGWLATDEQSESDKRFTRLDVFRGVQRPLEPQRCRAVCLPAC